MDIRQLAVSATSRLVLNDAKGDPIIDGGKEVAVNLYGPGSKQFAKAKNAQSNRIVDKFKSKGKTEQTPEQSAKEVASFLAECTESFENLEYDELTGTALAEAVYADQTLGFIADQVNKYIGDWANFLPPSKKS